MIFRIILGFTVVLLTTQAWAGDIVTLAGCTNRVFREINTTRKWSGQPPAACSARVAVEKRDDGIFVTAWRFRNGPSGWERTAFSGAMGFAEVASRKELTRAERELLNRAARLERCLHSILAVNDPLECRDRATKSYLAGEATGMETDRIIWLDDNGRHAVAGYTRGNTSSSPVPPADLFGGERVLPGIILNLHMR